MRRLVQDTLIVAVVGGILVLAGYFALRGRAAVDGQPMPRGTTCGTMRWFDDSIGDHRSRPLTKPELRAIELFLDEAVLEQHHQLVADATTHEFVIEGHTWVVYQHCLYIEPPGRAQRYQVPGLWWTNRNYPDMDKLVAWARSRPGWEEPGS